MKDYRTWWRKENSGGLLMPEMSGVLLLVGRLFKTWDFLDRQIGWDNYQFDCIAEQLWAIREGLA